MCTCGANSNKVLLITKNQLSSLMVLVNDLLTMLLTTNVKTFPNAGHSRGNKANIIIVGKAIAPHCWLNDIA
jgi:hypothetical protein